MLTFSTCVWANHDVDTCEPRWQGEMGAWAAHWQKHCISSCVRLNINRLFHHRLPLWMGLNVAVVSWGPAEADRRLPVSHQLDPLSLFVWTGQDRDDDTSAITASSIVFCCRNSVSGRHRGSTEEVRSTQHSISSNTWYSRVYKASGLIQTTSPYCSIGSFLSQTT